jgi:hypothetical protein
MYDYIAQELPQVLAENLPVVSGSMMQIASCEGSGTTTQYRRSVELTLVLPVPFTRTFLVQPSPDTLWQVSDSGRTGSFGN